MGNTDAVRCRRSKIHRTIPKVQRNNWDTCLANKCSVCTFGNMDRVLVFEMAALKIKIKCPPSGGRERS